MTAIFDKLAAIGGWLARYWKFLIAALTPVFLVIQASVTDDQITAAEWWAIAGAFVVAVGVLAKGNRPVEQ